MDDVSKVQITSPANREKRSSKTSAGSTAANKSSTRRCSSRAAQRLHRFAGDAAENKALYAVNVDTTESELARLDASSLPSSWIVTPFSNGDSSLSSGSLGSVGLQQMLLIAVLVIALD